MGSLIQLVGFYELLFFLLYVYVLILYFYILSYSLSSLIPKNIRGGQMPVYLYLLAFVLPTGA